MRTNVLKSLMIITALVFSFAACDQNDGVVSDDDKETAQNNAYSDAEYADMDMLAQNTMLNNEASLSEIADGPAIEQRNFACGTLTFDRENKKVTIDYAGCLGPDGRTRRGKVFLVYTGLFRTNGAKVTITTENYFVNDIKIEGTRVIENLGYNQAEKSYSHKITLTGGKLTFPDGKVISRTANFTRTWSLGSGEADYTFTITGSASGVNKNGVSYTSNIGNPLVWKYNCGEATRRYPVSGSVVLKRTGKSDVQINYGSGSCDNIATLTVNGLEFNVTMQ